MNQGKIDWAHTDVHPPAYYEILSMWMGMKPQWILEHHWSRMLSAIFGLIFITFAFLSIERLFGMQKAVFVGVLLSISTTVLHYSSETRSYMLLAMLSAIALYGVVRFTEEREYVWFCVMIAAIYLGILANYYAALMLPFYFMMLLIVDAKNKQKWKYLAAMLFMGTAIVAYVLVTFALPQMGRGEGMWFMPSQLSSYPSSLMFALFQPVLEYMTGVQSVIYLLFTLAAIVTAYFVVKHLYGTEISRAKRFEIAFLFAAIFPFIGMVAVKLLPTGYTHLYHHRFFLDVTWMFAVLVLMKGYELIDSFKKPVFVFTGMALVLGVFALMYVVYASGQFHEQKSVFDKIPCEQVMVVHQSTWTMLPAKVMERERGCTLTKHVVSTGLNLRQSYTAGFDALRSDEILWNSTYPEGNFYLVDIDSVLLSKDNIWNGRFGSTVKEEEGIALKYIEVDINGTGTSMATSSS
jgi:uncharacterized membrane protein